jgi:hypothetical protein
MRAAHKINGTSLCTRYSEHRATARLPDSRDGHWLTRLGSVEGYAELEREGDSHDIPAIISESGN